MAPHFKSCMALKDAFHEAGFEHDWLITTNESLITRARDTSAAAFLDTDFQKMLFIDGDIEFKPEDVAMLWNLDAPVAVGAYRLKHPGSKLLAWISGELKEASDYNEPTPVDFAGTGFMMIDRQVLEDMKAHVPEYLEGRGADNKAARRKCWGFFQDPIMEDTHLSEDYFFCLTYREKMGGEVLWHPHISLKHWGLHPF